MLNTKQHSDLLSISGASAYKLVQKEDFPSLRIGKRIVVPKGSQGNRSLLTRREYRLITTKPTDAITWAGLKRNGSLRYTILPIQNLIDWFDNW